MPGWVQELMRFQLCDEALSRLHCLQSFQVLQTCHVYSSQFLALDSGHFH